MLHLHRVDKEDHLCAAFSYFDKDGSGYITKDELQQACREFGIEENHVEEIIHEADQDQVFSWLFLFVFLSNCPFFSMGQRFILFWYFWQLDQSETTSLLSLTTIKLRIFDPQTSLM